MELVPPPTWTITHSIEQCTKEFTMILRQLKLTYGSDWKTAEMFVESVRGRITEIFDKLIKEEFFDNVDHNRNETAQAVPDILFGESTFDEIQRYLLEDADTDLNNEMYLHVVEANQPSLIALQTSSSVFQVNNETVTNIIIDSTIEHSSEEMNSMEQSSPIDEPSSTSTTLNAVRSEPDFSTQMNTVHIVTDSLHENSSNDESDNVSISPIKAKDDVNEKENGLIGTEKSNQSIVLETQSNQESNSSVKQWEIFQKASTSRKRPRERVGKLKMKNFECEVCHKKFNAMSYLVYHRRLHLDMFPIHCTNCLQNFSTRKAKTIHENTCEIRRYECYLCRRIIQDKSKMPEHMRVHTGEKPFSCSQCPMSFSQNSTWHNHMRTHTGEKPFQCLKCKKRFSLKYSWTKHLSKKNPCK